MENSFLTILLIAAGVILMLMLLGAFKKSGGSSGFRKQGQQQQNLGSSQYACSGIRQSSNYSTCCNNCYMCTNNGLVRDPDCLNTSNGRRHPENCPIVDCTEFQCSDPASCQKGCQSDYGVRCTGGNPYEGGIVPMSDADCRNDVVNSSTWQDCVSNCDDDDGNEVWYGCTITNKQKCYDACCNAGKC